MENVLRFEHPEYLYWLLIIPVLVIIYILFRLGQKRRFERFAHIEMREQLVPSYSSRRSTFKFVIFLLIIACSILALANLQSGSKMEEVKREGIDLYIAVDVSNSMNAEDIVPSRLERSKRLGTMSSAFIELETSTAMYRSIPSRFTSSILLPLCRLAKAKMELATTSRKRMNLKTERRDE